MKYSINITLESEDKKDGREGTICKYGLYETDNWNLGIDLINSFRMILDKILDKSYK